MSLIGLNWIAPVKCRNMNCCEAKAKSNRSFQTTMPTGLLCGYVSRAENGNTVPNFVTLEKLALRPKRRHGRFSTKAIRGLLGCASIFARRESQRLLVQDDT